MSYTTPPLRRLEYAQYYIRKYSEQFGLDKSKLEDFMSDFIGDEWMTGHNKS